ncbi:DNA-directed RNA polymerase subunit beta [Nannocystis exedens]|uniref:DNA-directed RNA polymerase subunit beta n=2 Tax=Nannocystis exedens TaxID=54 RepID=A0A1I2IPY1_9BACT|nr:DNA-directed RNA polymerase subunit beta [Nannocystis exedens]PCC70026.1 DNA-directed RNA polymerase subunit beta [Nannocystis exedens]SFF43693.1 DNA-directed RNA polymerase subunit beta [Nannocystis exedens]
MPPMIQNNFRVRKNFGKLKRIIEVPNLIDIQKRSYDKFLQRDVPLENREEIGLQAVFKSVFPIKDFGETSSLEFVSYSLDRPKYDEDECRARGMTFAAPIKVVVRLVVWDVDDETGTQSIRDVKEQEVYFGEIPLMTAHGTFIINGTERVVVSQLHRSPGVFFDHDKGKTHASGKKLFSARIIPYRGSWLDFEFDHKDTLFVRIDRRRKLHATVLLRALGYNTPDLLDFFYDKETINIEEGGVLTRAIDFDLLAGQRASHDIRDPETGEVIVRKGRKFTKANIKRMRQSGIRTLPMDAESLVGKVSAEDVIDENTGEVLLNCNEDLTEEHVRRLADAKIKSFKILFIDDFNVGPYLRNTLLQDKLHTPEDALLEIYRRLRPGDPPTAETARTLFESLFFKPERYDLSTVGRLKLNHKFGLEESLTSTVLTKRDIMETVKYLVELRNGRGQIDDIDHLGNRRVRAVGELMENQYRIGLVRMERAIKERMSMSQEMDALMPADLINAKPVSAVVKEYFASSQLSQFMDQTNPLSEVTHKRRLSALGPGGLTRERAGFEVRDVHNTHYGRICPIETPEGPNIGLIASLSTYARINEFGFIETPYRTVDGGVASSDVDYYSALQEQGHFIAQANAVTDDSGKLLADQVQVRHNDEFESVPPASVTLMDVSPSQLVSVAASLIPFLEHDDANRALMGSNMQRQAVPCLRTAAPLIGTGMEMHVARDSGSTVVALRDGVVEQVDGARIVVKPVTGKTEENRGILGAKPDIYNLTKFQRSNQNTALNQKPIVRVGDRVKKGDVIADGAATERGELALGQNVVVAFMPWQGYNFEDSILVSERIVREDVYTSIHIEEFECVARDTKLGKEEITRDIPNVGEDALANLDEAGIARIGAEVKAGDILVGKITPKGETQLSPEEKLLRAIFGEKAGDVRDTSLRLPPGVSGIVIDARVFARKSVEKDTRAQQIEDAEREKLMQDRRDNVAIVSDGYYNRMKEILVGKTTAAKLVDDAGRELIAAGVVLTEANLADVPRSEWGRFSLTTAEDTEVVEALARRLEKDLDEIETIYREKIAKLTKGDELPPGVIKMVKVYVAIKRKLQVGDKMAGRHGNKGVISRILPIEDLPYLEDGSPVDIVLNPLGVPSRMNVGQILEVHLGWAAYELGQQIDRYMQTKFSPEVLRTQLKKIYETKEAQRFIDGLGDDDVIRFADKLRRGVHMATPVFDGALETEVKGTLSKAGVPESGQAILFDGRTGEAFEENVTVGIMYMLKLHHLVDDKIHARSIGPYSLVTQQPLGGKAQFGGQRLGEMEVWALEAYGAAYALQELLTVKSDDVVGRMRMYESIVKGQPTMQPGVPESFNVLLKELQALCLNIELVDVNAETGVVTGVSREAMSAAE